MPPFCKRGLGGVVVPGFLVLLGWCVLGVNHLVRQPPMCTPAQESQRLPRKRRLSASRLRKRVGAPVFLVLLGLMCAGCVATALAWHWHGIGTALPQQCSSIATASAWHCHRIATALPQRCHSIATALALHWALAQYLTSNRGSLQVHVMCGSHIVKCFEYL